MDQVGTSGDENIPWAKRIESRRNTFVLIGFFRMTNIIASLKPGDSRDPLPFPPQCK
jgi:hypothetical protein